MKRVLIISKSEVPEIKINDLEQFGLTLVDKADVIEVWAEDSAS